MASERRPPPLAIALLIVLGVVVALALLVPLYAGVASNAEPRDLPVVVAGPAPAADGVAAQLAQERPGAFDIIRLDDAPAADQALRDRDAYAAFVVGPDGLSLHTASAASPVVAQLLTQAAAAQSGGAPGTPVQVVDVVPGSAEDPRGAGFAAGFLPLVLTSMIAGIALTVIVTAKRARLVGLVLYGVLAGLVGTAVLQSWLGVLDGDYLANAAAISLLAFAVSTMVTGLGTALGGPGLGLGVLLAFLLGNPLSAVSSAPELLPQPWGEVGQWLPQGAGATLLRSVVWFDGAGTALPLWVLSGWAVLGLLLVLVGRATVVRSRAPGPAAPAAQAAAEPSR